jgi:hypothetical protein
MTPDRDTNPPRSRVISRGRVGALLVRRFGRTNPPRSRAITRWARGRIARHPRAIQVGAVESAAEPRDTIASGCIAKSPSRDRGAGRAHRAFAIGPTRCRKSGLSTNPLDRFTVALDTQQAHCELSIDETRWLPVCVRETKCLRFSTTARDFARSARTRGTKYRVVEGTHVAG